MSERREAAPDAVPVASGAVERGAVDASGVVGADGYAAMFDHARDGLLRDHLGLVDRSELARVRVVKGSTEQRRPLHARDRYRIDARLLGYEPPYLHVFFQLWHGDEIAAASQQLLHYTSAGGSDTTMPAGARAAAVRLYRNQEGLPLPLGADASIGIP